MTYPAVAVWKRRGNIVALFKELNLLESDNVNHKGDSILAWATKVGVGPLRHVLRLGVDIRLRSRNGRYAFHEAARLKDGALRLRALLDHVPLGDLPELLNLQDGDGYTPLHWAASEANTSAIRLLLGYGADVAVPGRLGVLPLGTLLENTYWRGARWGGASRRLGIYSSPAHGVMWEHVTKLLVIGAYGGQESKHLLVDWPPMRPKRFFESEAVKMENFYIKDTSKTVLDLLFISDIEFLKVMRFKRALKFLIHPDFLQLFPCYGSLIRFRIRMIKRVWKKYETIVEIIQERLPLLCAERIAEYALMSL